MHRNIRSGFATAILCCLPALRAQVPANDHFVVTNDNVSNGNINGASVYKLTGSTLTLSSPLITSGKGVPVQFFGVQQQTIATVGRNVCTFVSDGATSDIVAFNTTHTPVTVGTYSDSTGSGDYAGIALAARGSLLIAGYTNSSNIGVWTINADCSLTLASPASATPTSVTINGMGISPDQKTVVVTSANNNSFDSVQSFAVSGVTLNSTGLYSTTGTPGGVDFTPDSQYLLLGDYNQFSTQVDLFAVGSDGTLSGDDFYQFDQGGADSSNVWFSPDASVVYVSNNDSHQITVLRFNETGATHRKLIFECVSSPLRNPAGGSIVHSGGLATASVTGKGGYLYVAEVGTPNAIGLLQIVPGSCPVEVNGSPFMNPTSGFPTTLSAYPPRPF
jgi:6-phosphogluconolactonase (cycloisomerase 2 family)